MPYHKRKTINFSLKQELRLPSGDVVTSTSAGKMHVEKARPKINISLKGKDETYYVEAIRAGYNNTINFYKDSNYTIPLANPDAYQTLTNKTLDYNDIEEAPIDLISATNRSYALEAINEESKMMLEDDLHFGGWDGSKWRIGRTNMINFNGLKRQTININSY